MSRNFNNDAIEVRPMTKEECHLVVNYFHSSSHDFLTGMGADKNLLPPREEWIQRLGRQVELPLKDKSSFCVIWLLEEQPIGHSALSDIEFGQKANMHLHMWSTKHRKQGLGRRCVRRSIKMYFSHFELRELFCQPFAKNPAPNRVMQSIGFELVRQEQNTPGLINFEQMVNIYRLSHEAYLERVASW